MVRGPVEAVAPNAELFSPLARDTVEGRRAGNGPVETGFENRDERDRRGQLPQDLDRGDVDRVVERRGAFKLAHRGQDLIVDAKSAPKARPGVDGLQADGVHSAGEVLLQHFAERGAVALRPGDALHLAARQEVFCREFQELVLQGGGTEVRNQYPPHALIGEHRSAFYLPASAARTLASKSDAGV